MKKTAAVILSLILSILMNVTASALYDTTVIPAGTLNKVLDAYRGALKRGDAYVSLSEYGIYDGSGGEAYNELYRMLLFTNGDTGSMNFGKYSETFVTSEIEKDPSTGMITGVSIDYSERYKNADGTCNTDLVKSDEKLISARYNAAKAIVNRKMTDVEKALVLYDYIVTHADYSVPTGTDSDGEEIYPDDAYTAIGYLRDREAVCAAYSKLYALLLNDSGIPAVTVDSEDINHEWVMLKVDGEWYHADPTWDDPYLTDGYTILYDMNEDNWDIGCVTHYYFLKSDEEIIELEHPNWNIYYDVNPEHFSEPPVSGESGKFDDMFFSDKNEDYLCCSAMNYINGYWYFIDLNSYSVIRADINGYTEKIELPEDVFPKYSFGYDNDLYILTNKRLYRYDTVSDKNEKILEVPEDKPDTVFSEMRIIDDEMTIVSLDYTFSEDDEEYEPISFTSSEIIYQMQDLKYMSAMPDDGDSEEGETAVRSDNDNIRKFDGVITDTPVKEPDIDEQELIELAQVAGTRIRSFIYLGAAAVFVIFAAIAIILAVKYSKKK